MIRQVVGIAGIALFGLAPALAAQDRDGGAPPATRFSVEFSRSGPLIATTPASFTIRALGAGGEVATGFEGRVELTGVTRHPGGEPLTEAGPLVRGVLVVESVQVPAGAVSVTAAPAGSSSISGRAERLVLPGWVTLLPPLIAIVLALISRQVTLSLFCGVWVGALLVHGFNPLTAFLRGVDTYVVGALADSDHACIVVFSLALAGMVGVITATGGVRGIVELVSSRATSARGGQVATALMGVLIFFDDYANALIVGNTMRPLTDRLRISREKLSFLVDSTAAPVATIGIVSTWTAYQLGLIREELPAAGLGGENAYIFFLLSIPFSFYSILMLFLVFVCAASGRDFGPMRRAEERSLTTGAVIRHDAQPLVSDEISGIEESGDSHASWIDAVAPIACVVVFTLLGLYSTGLEGARSAGIAAPSLREVLGHGDSFRALLWAAAGASVVAGALAIRKGWPFAKVVDRWLRGAKSLILAIVILLLAWSISAVCKELHTGDYILSITRDVLTVQHTPALAFVTAGVIAFATGTSYGTMGILIPVLLPLAGQLSLQAGLDEASVRQLCQATVAGILGGAVFGDHCSPISDTTVLSSMASGADHVDHVHTQFPYALLVALVCVPCFLAVGYGWSTVLVLPAGAVALAVIFRLISAPVK